MKKFWLIADENGELVPYWNGLWRIIRNRPEYFARRLNGSYSPARFDSIDDAEKAAKELNRKYLRSFLILQCVAKADISTHICKMED